MFQNIGNIMSLLSENPSLAAHPSPDPLQSPIRTRVIPVLPAFSTHPHAILSLCFTRLALFWSRKHEFCPRAFALTYSSSAWNGLPLTFHCWSQLKCRLLREASPARRPEEVLLSMLFYTQPPISFLNSI